MQRRKKILSIAATIFLLGHTSYSGKYIPRYQIIDSNESKAFARYSNGFIYIGDEKFLENINPNKMDILVLDDREIEDPNMKIFSSYQIKDFNTRKEILEILIEYEKSNPSKWDRSIESMQIEWYVHNIMYLFNYDLDRTKDVDFNNNDEDIYNIKKRLSI